MSHRPKTEHSIPRRIWLVGAYAGASLLPLLLAWTASTRSPQTFLYEAGKAAALVGFVLLCLQVVLSARLRLLDRAFGLDVLLRFHGHMAILGGILLLSHPLLIKLGAGKDASFEGVWQVQAGQAALVLLLLLTFGGLIRLKIPLDYRFWRFAHKGTLLVILIGFIHSSTIGSDLQGGLLKPYWWLLIAASVGLFLYRNILVPLLLKQRFTVKSIEQAARGTWTLALVPAKGKVFDYRAGQFMFLKLSRKGFRSEEHPFTLSSSPTQEGVAEVTIKESGDFTRTIGKTQVGDRADIEAAFGRFTLAQARSAPSGELLFIAGGVGVTPFISMLRDLRNRGDVRPVTLLFGNRSEADILFRQELEKMPEHVKVVHILSSPGPDWAGAKGYVNAEAIAKHGGDFLKVCEVFLCGPPPMMKAVIEDLKDLGVEKSRIHFERFSL